MNRRVLVLGGSGLLGRAVVRSAPAGIAVVAPGSDELPLEDPDSVERRVASEKAEGLLLLAAWTDVDGCESDPARAFRTNGILAGEVARRAARAGIPLLFVSTDYVFAGDSPKPYREHDAVRPLSVYGASKWYGECGVREAGGDWRIVRTAGLYGPGGPDFVATIRGRLAAGSVDVVTDEVNTPTYVEDLAPAIWSILLGRRRGTWHLTHAGEASRYELARTIARLCGDDPEKVRPTTRAAFGRPAPRPARSVLDCCAASEVFGISLSPWEDALERFLRAEVHRERRPAEEEGLG